MVFTSLPTKKQLHAKWCHRGMVLLQRLVIKKQNHTTYSETIQIMNINYCSTQIQISLFSVQPRVVKSTNVSWITTRQVTFCRTGNAAKPFVVNSVGPIEIQLLWLFIDRPVFGPTTVFFVSRSSSYSRQVANVDIHTTRWTTYISGKEVNYFHCKGYNHFCRQ